MARKLEVQIVGDASSFKKALGDASGHTSRFGTALGSLAKAGVLAAGAAGVGALFVTLKAGISEFSQAAKVSAQTEAVIKSTGGSANVTAKQVDKLANSIMNYSGMDDEAVKAGENMLLTFTRVRNEAGAGNDVFTQATKTLADMSVALGQSMPRSAIQLGKALNDPIKGITALQRVGVTFTEGQKAQIKAMVESGNVMGAQKLILAELNREFGGSAEAAGKTLPGQLNILKESFNNMAGAIVGAAVPAVTKFAQFMTAEGLPAIQKFAEGLIDRVGPAISGVADAFQKAGPGIMNVINPIWQVIQNNVVPIFQKLMQIGSEAITAIGNVLRSNGPQIKTIFENLGNVIKNLATIVIPILRVAFAVVLPAAIRVLIPILVAVTTILSALSAVVRVAASVIGTILVGAVSVARGAISGITTVIRALDTAFDNVRAAAVAVAGYVRGGLTGAFNTFKGVASSIKAIIDALASALRAVASAAREVAGALSSIRVPHISLPHIPGIHVPGFASGGVVPGPRGAPMLATVHGGETIIPPGQGGGDVYVTVNMPNYLGNARDAAREIRDELELLGVRNGSIGWSR